MDRQTSAVRIPLHPDVSLLAQCRRRLLCQTYQKAAQARRVPIPPRTQRRHPPLPRRHQRKPKALYLDQGPQQNHRSRQTRAPSVRFDPLDRWLPTVVISKGSLFLKYLICIDAIAPDYRVNLYSSAAKKNALLTANE